MDPHRTVILIRPAHGGEFEDKTSSVLSIQRENSCTAIRFKNKPETKRSYSDALSRVAWLPLVSTVSVQGDVVSINGEAFQSATEVSYFSDGRHVRSRVFGARKNGGEWNRLCFPEEVQVLSSALHDECAYGAMSHWRSIVSLLGSDDALSWPYEQFDFIHPDSALARYLGVLPSNEKNMIAAAMPRQATEGEAAEIIVPFNSNLSQYEALRRALREPVSIIEGPPGTGKTETILNIIANIIKTPGRSVGIVSFTNAAVDNVREKLEETGFGFVAADLGRKEKREAYFASQKDRSRAIRSFLRTPLPPKPEDGKINGLGEQLDKLLEISRSLAQDRRELAALELEQRHFALMAEQHEIPDLGKLPLLQKSSDRILDYLVETGNLRSEGSIPMRIFRRIRNYLRYGATDSLDPNDSNVLLAIEEGWYRAKIFETRARVVSAESALNKADFDLLQEQRTELSVVALRYALLSRYRGRSIQCFDSSTYRSKKNFSSFINQYPVILSTCHSIRNSLPRNFLLDYLIVDESSQVGILPAVLALSCARHVVVVGDLKQLPEIPPNVPEKSVSSPPLPAYDARKHSLLSSMIELFGETLPRTVLREHYRCHPDIIGFCNAMFYDVSLIPMTYNDRADKALHLVRLVEGTHMRHHREGGNTNQREAEVVAREVLTAMPDGQRDGEHVVVITPFRKQVDKITCAIAEQAHVQVEQVANVKADTVHKIQGRDKDNVVLSCVVDDSRSGRIATPFADDEHLVNVAVSRAKKRFVMVVDHSFLPRSKNLSRLVGWIRYNSPDVEYTQSRVISVFDLLYRNYSARLHSFQGRISQRSRYKSENIIWTLLNDILSKHEYRYVSLRDQVLLKDLLGAGAELTERERNYVKHRASFDFILSDAVTKGVILAIEVDGFESHENNVEQKVRDELKNSICERNGINLLRLETTGSDEERRICSALDLALAEGESFIPDSPQ